MAVSNFIQSVLDAAKGEQKSIGWYRGKIRDFGNPGVMDLIRDGQRAGGPNFGTLNMFVYSPKYKATLPFYDTFPLVLPISATANGFVGLNFHYLAIPTRVALLDRLTQSGSATASGRRFDENSSILTDYSSIKNIPMVKPTIKQYLYGYVKSQFRVVTPEEWVVAVLLPVQRFKKASASTVYAASRKLM